jgi:hypothetical protein
MTIIASAHMTHPLNMPSVSDIPQLADLSREYKRRIKLYVRHNFPSIGQWADGRTLPSTKNTKVYCTQFSLHNAIQSLPNTNSTFEDFFVSDLAAQCTLVPRQNATWYDIDGRKLVHYLPHLYPTAALSSLVTELHQLLHVFPPRKPAAYEKRSTKFEEWASQLGPNVRTGVIRLTYHHQIGHSHERPSPSADFLSGSTFRTTHTMDFRKSTVIHDLSDLISLLFASIDPISWRKY